MDNNSSIFVQAKIEYSKQLINTLKPHIYDGIKSIYDDAKDIYKENSSTSLLFIFRTLLEKIPEWNNELIVNETDRIIECSKCDWLDELVTAVYISHTKILMSIGNNNNNKINLTIPKLINFIHKCYINVARELWKNPLLFSEDISGFEYQKNINTIETIICNCIENTIRISLPVKEILKEHLDINDNNSQSNDSDNNLLNELKVLLMKNKLNDNEDKDEDKTNEEEVKDEDEEEVKDEDEEEEEVKDEGEVKDEDEVKDEVKDEDNIKNIEEINSNQNVFVNNDGYESPDEDIVNKKCENIEINDIPDIKVDQPIEENKLVEPVYDNPDIIDSSAKENDELYKKLIKINDENNNEEISTDNPIKVSKVDEVVKIEPTKEPEPIQEPVELSTEEKLKLEQESRDYQKIEDITEQEGKNKKVNSPKEHIVIEPNENKEEKHSKNDLSYIEDIIDNKKEDKEIMSVEKKDDDKETVDLFYDDLKKISEKKGLTMEPVDEDKYTLFDDLD
jgi:hypothetical protein